MVRPYNILAILVTFAVCVAMIASLVVFVLVDGKKLFSLTSPLVYAFLVAVLLVVFLIINITQELKRRKRVAALSAFLDRKLYIHRSGHVLAEQDERHHRQESSICGSSHTDYSTYPAYSVHGQTGTDQYRFDALTAAVLRNPADMYRDTCAAGWVVYYSSKGDETRRGARRDISGSGGERQG